MRARGFGFKHTSAKHESDIFEVRDSKDGLLILIDTVDENDNRVDLKVRFDYSNGYRFLDEGDLLRYWDAGVFVTPHHVFEILSGGWTNGELLDEGMLSISVATEVREWFIETQYGCITVLSNAEPIITRKKAK